MAVVGIGFAVNSSRDTTGDTPSATPAGVTDGYAVVVGEESAPTTITVYEDLQCPVCRPSRPRPATRWRRRSRTARSRWSTARSRSSTTRRPPTTPRARSTRSWWSSTRTARTLEAYHRLLFENQPAEGCAGLTDDQLIEYAVQAGADEDAVRGPIEDRKFHQWVVNATDQMSKDGVNGTPTVLIDGKPAGSTPQESAQAVLDAVG